MSNKQEIVLPELDVMASDGYLDSICNDLDCRERQLLAALTREQELRAELAEMSKILTASENWRNAYQDGKYALYAMGGEVCEAAAKHLPMSEGPLGRAARKIVGPPEELRVSFASVEAERDASRAELAAVKDGGWVDLPTSQGLWWHIYGDEPEHPFPYNILQSNSSNPPRFFVQHPDSRFCEDVGGKWCKAIVPNLPYHLKIGESK